LSVAYFSAVGSKKENWNSGSAVCAVSGITASSKFLVPLIANSSSWEKVPEGG